MHLRPDLVRDLSVQSMTAVRAYDGSVGWQIEPFRGRKEPGLTGEDNLRDLLLTADFDGLLVFNLLSSSLPASLKPAQSSDNEKK